jgi:antitoxin component YwqK of YwqJK toxin-antitoxin module
MRWRARSGGVVVLALVVVSACAPSRGRIETRHPNGRVRWFTETWDGRPEGATATYWPNGQLSSRGVHHQGVRHGPFEFFDETGAVVRRVVYRNGLAVWSSKGPDELPTADLVASVSGDAVSRWRDERPFFMAPDFVSTDRLVAGNKALLQVGFHLLEPEGEAGSIGQRVDAFGQMSFGNLVAYGNLTTARLEETSTTPGGMGKTTAELGGGLVSRRWDGGAIGDFRIAGRLGLLAPVAGDGVDGYYIGSRTIYERLTDGVAALPHALALRPGGSLMGQAGRLYYRADAGVDVAMSIASEDARVRMAEPIELLGRLNLAAGLGGRTFSATVELSNLVALNDSSVDERFAHGLTISAHLRGNIIRPHFGVVTPLDPAAFGSYAIFIAGAEWAEGGEQ